jgi:TonB family protein
VFDFAVSQNQQRRPTKRVVVSWVLSGLLHSMILFSLVKYPQLLQGGVYHRYRAISLFTNILKPKSDNDAENWRTVTVLKSPSRMSAPSAATLKKYLYDWDKKGSNAPPIRIRWGDIEVVRPDLPPMPRLKQEAQKPDISLPANALIPSDTNSAAEAADASRRSVTVQKDLEKAKKGADSLPPPKPVQKTETAGNNPPSKIPDSIKPPPPNIAPAPKDAVRVFENEQKAIRSADSGFFDTEGFPLGEYTKLIVDRITGKWLIPSNLRNSQGHTTVVFYIDRGGRFMNARIVMSSGNNSLDLAALNAVIESNPFPPLPEGFPGDHVGAKFVFSYNEPQ